MSLDNGQKTTRNKWCILVLAQPSKAVAIFDRQPKSFRNILMAAQTDNKKHLFS